jgi:hypothetical protein
MASTADSDLAEKERIALERYQFLYVKYLKARLSCRLPFYIFQTLVIVLSGITPLLILTTDSKLLQAAPAATASVLAGLLSVFRFNEHWVRRSTAAAALESEMVKYSTRAGAGYGGSTSPEAALEHFVLTMERIAEEEKLGWGRARLQPVATTTRTEYEPRAAADADRK